MYDSKQNKHTSLAGGCSCWLSVYTCCKHSRLSNSLEETILIIKCQKPTKQTIDHWQSLEEEQNDFFQSFCSAIVKKCFQRRKWKTLLSSLSKVVSKNVVQLDSMEMCYVGRTRKLNFTGFLRWTRLGAFKGPQSQFLFIELWHVWTKTKFSNP